MTSPIHRAVPILLLLGLVLGPAAVAQGTAGGPVDYSRTTYTSEATFVYEGPEEGRILEMIPERAVVGVDVCHDGWCPVRYEGTTGFVPRSALTSPPSIPIRPSTANPDVYSAPARPAPQVNPEFRSGREISNPPPDAYEELKAVPVEAAFVGSKRSQVFHRSSCRHVSRIAPHNLIMYESAADAVAQGKRGCQSCRPADD